MADPKAIQNNIVDRLLIRNPYLKNLSIADRLSTYNEALKQVAIIRPIIYSNCDDNTFLVTSNEVTTLSNIMAIDNILIDNLSDLTESERLIIYNITQMRIGALRVIQQQSHYTLNNLRSTIMYHTKNLLMTLSYNIGLLKYRVEERIKNFPISFRIETLLNQMSTKILTLPIMMIITQGLLKVAKLIMPLELRISILRKLEYVKNLVCGLSFTIINYQGSKLKIRRLTMSLVIAIIRIASFQKSKERRMVLPLSITIKNI